MTRNKKLILLYAILGICVFVLVGVFTTNLKYFFLCSDHFIVDCWQTSETQEEQNSIIIIPCSNNKDCSIEKMGDFCNPDQPNLLKCAGAKYYCEEDGYCKGCACPWYFPIRWLSVGIEGFNDVCGEKDCHDKIDDIQDKRKVVKTYLEENIWKPNRDGETFCAYEILGAECDLDTCQYLWVLCKEYYLENSRLREGGGTSLPVAITLQRENDIYKVISHKVPRAGSLYKEDIEKIFPECIQNKIFSNVVSNHNQRVKILEDEIKKEIEENPCAVCINGCDICPEGCDECLIGIEKKLKDSNMKWYYNSDMVK